jgi:hypothetical protein
MRFKHSARLFVLFFLIIFFAIFYLSNIEAVELEGFKLDVKTGFSYINSKDLNTITQGFNAGYGTDFGNIHMPVVLNFALMMELGRSAIGLETAYEFANRDSYSSIYNFVERINFSAVPFGIKYQYKFYKDNRFFLTADASTGVMFLKFKTSNSPSIMGSDVSFNSYANSWYFCAGLGSTYFINNLIGINASLNFRYATSSVFKYSSDNSRYNSGDEVRFSDGSSLTINLFGLQFLLGIVLNWSL